MRHKVMDRRVNRIVRDMNKNIYNDEIWKGRFELRQVKKSVKPYSDNSGYDYSWTYRIWDKETGAAADMRFNQFTIKYKLWEFVNNFIVKACNVWEEDPRPSKDSPDYRNVPVPAHYTVISYSNGYNFWSY